MFPILLSVHHEALFSPVFLVPFAFLLALSIGYPLHRKGLFQRLERRKYHLRITVEAVIVISHQILDIIDWKRCRKDVETWQYRLNEMVKSIVINLSRSSRAASQTSGIRNVEGRLDVTDVRIVIGSFVSLANIRSVGWLRLATTNSSVASRLHSLYTVLRYRLGTRPPSSRSCKA